MENQSEIKELIGKIRAEIKEPSENISQYLAKTEELLVFTPPTAEEKKLYEELGIGEDREKQKVVSEIKKLADLKGVKIDFKEATEGSIFLLLDQKDKEGNFCPSLVFWTLAQELSTVGGDKTNRTPEFWNNFFQELEWVKQNSSSEYFQELEELTIPSLFPTEKLEMKELLSVYYPASETGTENQTTEVKIRKEIVDKLWQNLRQEVLELVQSELSNSPSEEKLAQLAFKLTADGSANQQYTLQIDYHPQIPFKDKISQLMLAAPLQLENELLKAEKEQLPTPENFEKLQKQNTQLENCLQDLTDEEKFKEIKAKINKTE